MCEEYNLVKSGIGERNTKVSNGLVEFIKRRDST